MHFVYFSLKDPFVPSETKANLCKDILLHVLSIINKKIVLLPTLFLFCAYSGKMVIQKTKKNSLIIFRYLHNHNLYLLVKINNPNHALINPLNTLTMYSLPTLSSLYSKLKKT